MKRSLVVITLLMAAFLAACGPPDQNAASGGSESSGGQEAAAAATPTPVVLATPTPKPAPPTPTPRPTPTPAPIESAPEPTAEGEAEAPAEGEAVTEAPTEEPAAPAGPLFDDMVLIEAGSFSMGQDGSKPKNGPAHDVDLPAYEIDRFEVTNDEYAWFAEQTGYATYAEGNSSKNFRDASEGKGNHPVVYVTWDDAKAYCEWAAAADRSRMGKSRSRHRRPGVPLGQ